MHTPHAVHRITFMYGTTQKHPHVCRTGCSHSSFHHRHNLLPLHNAPQNKTFHHRFHNFTTTTYPSPTYDDTIPHATQDTRIPLTTQQTHHSTHPTIKHSCIVPIILLQSPHSPLPHPKSCSSPQCQLSDRFARGHHHTGHHTALRLPTQSTTEKCHTPIPQPASCHTISP